MNRLIILLLSLFLLNNCSLSKNSKIWKEKEKNLENKNIKNVFLEKKIITSEFNQKLKLINIPKELQNLMDAEVIEL